MFNPEAIELIAAAVGLKTWPSFLDRTCCDKKEVFLNGGWRGGKSNTAAFITFVDILTKWLATPVTVDSRGQPIGYHLIWIVGPQFEQAREEYHYIAEWCQRLNLVVEASTATLGPLRMTISKPGMPGVVVVATKSADDPMSLGSVAPVLILAAECGQFSEEAKEWLLGRAIEKNATILWSGTFHNDQGKAIHAWYERDSAEATAHPTARRQAFCLPSWENMYLFGNCLEGENSIENDSTLREWCPDANHGVSHSGMDHPVIRMRHWEYRDRPREWDKRFGGIATGVSNPVYEWSLRDNLEDFSDNHYLVPMPDSMTEKDYQWMEKAGGMDFGSGGDTGHPSAVCVGGLTWDTNNRDSDLWVLDCPMDKSGRMDWVWTTRELMSKVYRIKDSMWARDPMAKWMPTYVPGEAMTGGLFARENRVGWVNSGAEGGHLFFNARNPSVVVLFAQLQGIHRKRQANGQLVYDRTEDDAVAAFEDMVAMLLARPHLRVSTRQPIPSHRVPTAVRGRSSFVRRLYKNQPPTKAKSAS